MSALQRKYFGPKKSKRKARKRSKTMARRKNRKSKGRKRSGGRRTRRRGRRGGGGGYALKPSGEDLKMIAACAAVGFVEGKAKSDDSFFLNKIPKPVDVLGFTGNLALVAWFGSHFLKNRWLRLGARAAANITGYQLGRKGSPFGSGKEFFSISGYDDDDVKQMLDASLGALAADANGGDGLSWDEAAANAMQMVGPG
jgi:hypothetical protein